MGWLPQCNALLYVPRSKVGLYCMRVQGHFGCHRTDSGVKFSEARAKYIAEGPPHNQDFSK